MEVTREWWQTELAAGEEKREGTFCSSRSDAQAVLGVLDSHLPSIMFMS